LDLRPGGASASRALKKGRLITPFAETRRTTACRPGRDRNEIRLFSSDPFGRNSGASRVSAALLLHIGYPFTSVFSSRDSSWNRLYEDLSGGTLISR
jgi:hypothetical protein